MTSKDFSPLEMLADCGCCEQVCRLLLSKEKGPSGAAGDIISWRRRPPCPRKTSLGSLIERAVLRERKSHKNADFGDEERSRFVHEETEKEKRSQSEKQPRLQAI